MPGIENLAPERTTDQQRVERIAELATHRLLELEDVLGDLLVETVRPAAVHVVTAGIGRDRETRRHRQAQHGGHLGEVGTLAAEQILVAHRGLAVLVIEGIRRKARDASLGRHRPSAPGIGRTTRRIRDMFRLFGFDVHVRTGFLIFLGLIVFLYQDTFGLWLAGASRRVHAAARARPRRRGTLGRRGGRDLARLPRRLHLVPTRPQRPLSRARRAVISVAGPVTQIAVSLAVLAAMGVNPLSLDSARQSDAALAIWWAGPIIGALNLIPVLPLDGGHLAMTGLETFLGKRAPEDDGDRQPRRSPGRWRGADVHHRERRASASSSRSC